MILFIDSSKLRQRVRQQVPDGRQEDEGGVPVPRSSHGGGGDLYPYHPSLEDLLVHGVEDLHLAFVLEAGQSDHLDLLLGADHRQVGGTVVRLRDNISFDFVGVGNWNTVVVENKEGDDWSSMEKRVVLAFGKEGEGEGERERERERENNYV